MLYRRRRSQRIFNSKWRISDLASWWEGRKEANSSNHKRNWNSETKTWNKTRTKSKTKVNLRREKCVHRVNSFNFTRHNSKVNWVNYWSNSWWEQKVSHPKILSSRSSDYSDDTFSMWSAVWRRIISCPSQSIKIKLCWSLSLKW